ncbi:MAG: hypothetical protein ACYTKD_31920 [Planctomycetota bacterium]
MSRGFAAALLFAALWAPPAGSVELWSRGEASLDFGGSVRELAVVTRGTDAEGFADAIENTLAAGSTVCVLAATFSDCAAFGEVGDVVVASSLTRLRLRFDLRVNAHWSAVAVYDNEVRAGRLDTLETALGEGIASESLLHAEYDTPIGDGDHARWRTLLYRGYLFFESERFEVTLGRQRIAWGVGRLWNPIDRFNAIPPLSLQPDQSPGVDSVDARWLISGFTFLEAVFAPRRVTKDSSYALRLHGVVRNVDYSLVAGVFEEAWTVGFDLAGNVGGAAARLEVVYANPERDVWPVGAARPGELDDFWQVVGSIDHLFDVGNGIYALVEHLYNGNALGFGRGRAGPLLPFFESTAKPPSGLPPGAFPPDAVFVTQTSVDRFGGSRVVTRSRHLTGVQLGYDVVPEVRAELLAIYDWSGSSAIFFPTLSYDALDWLELILGAQFPLGPHRSEFGSAENLAYLLAEFHF